MTAARQQQAHEANIYNRLALQAVDWADKNPSLELVRNIIVAYHELTDEYPEFFDALPNDNHAIYVMQRMKGGK